MRKGVVLYSISKICIVFWQSERRWVPVTLQLFRERTEWGPQVLVTWCMGTYIVPYMFNSCLSSYTSAYFTWFTNLSCLNCFACFSRLRFLGCHRCFGCSSCFGRLRCFALLRVLGLLEVLGLSYGALVVWGAWFTSGALLAHVGLLTWVA